MKRRANFIALHDTELEQERRCSLPFSIFEKANQTDDDAGIMWVLNKNRNQSKRKRESRAPVCNRRSTRLRHQAQLSVAFSCDCVIQFTVHSSQFITVLPLRSEIPSFKECC
jgi:hypothetical protein